VCVCVCVCVFRPEILTCIRNPRQFLLHALVYNGQLLYVQRLYSTFTGDQVVVRFYAPHSRQFDFAHLCKKKITFRTLSGSKDVYMWRCTECESSRDDYIRLFNMRNVLLPEDALVVLGMINLCHHERC
jgi:hypothetical protein